jgi:hypothetical protein
MTIQQILKSLNRNQQLFQTENNGDYLSAQELIDKTSEYFWKRITPNEYLTKDFKDNFLLKFFNSEISFETVEPFFNKLSVILNTECIDMLRVGEQLRKETLDELMSTNHNKTTSDNKTRQSSKNLEDTTPETNKNIVFNFDKDNDSLINYANRILENFNKGDYHTETESKGRNSQPLYQLYYTLSQLTNIYNQIYNICDEKLFMQIF